MAGKDGKTERPTPKRLRDARKRGEVPKSQEVSAAAALFVFSLVLLPSWEFVIEHYLPYLTQFLEQVAAFKVQYRDLPKIAVQAVLMIFFLAAPFMILSVLVAFLANFAQTGFLFSTKPLKPDFKRLNPVNGFKQMLGLRSVFNMGKTLAKFGIIVYFCYREFMDNIPIMLNLSSVGTPKVLLFVLNFAQALTFKVALLLLVLALIDYFYQRYSFRKNLRMSKEEIKEEFKQQEGDPKVKSQRKARYQAMVRNAIAKVKDATVLITNPTHFALAIKYDPQKEGIPVLLAKGKDDLAQRMKAEARKEHVPLIENRPVAHAIYAQVEPGEFVPPELYESVAEIIALVYQLDEKEKNKI
ncbi:flagellar biosynthesis protein FlhB [Liquorilactobacillus satsumensis]|uniref:Flagellar biosynthetic protein FlhB n=2 Tax=Liquorilactobacillus satsumensis TaxID=259059 RepID=A0A0R1V0W0_9LACO|nr:flagellar biosynthesis protein FlhB [Liquorilactobacillus satsumensis]AJA34303.1 flagellar biosynthetic protein FlhB [Liquorilactobacillus satsumensis]KRL99150.1 bifunctional flagellar biosynthesis protein FliR FlhB [Liquorilactobacillus satsumensis DSM 16230 = JCM 12392]MCC7666604.1 flagellar biosynthesis protein FlhB [Liquorilactobacillus satsumensis]MCP9312865.1 flagellar biosynthesis protein FlhB [Liquorilactobacillus satsumensis]MCP9329274.1 flagellar biosynthesis protein FlhB [Liquori